VRISILGFGLIGGSIARALHERAEAERWQVTAWSRSLAPAERALNEGTIHAVASTVEQAVVDAELVVLAAPPLACVELVDLLAGSLRGRLPDDYTITDVASSKARIVERADNAGMFFIGGHPMAGRELSGYAAAQPDLFVERPWVTVLGRHARFCDADRVAELIDACGAIQVPMDAAAHDSAVAAISHLPLVASAALVEAVAGGPGDLELVGWRAARALAATGWDGMTRLARGEPDMAAGIAATNTEALVARLRQYRAVLDVWLADLEREGGPDPGRLKARFGSARARLTDSDES
jgi:prephenate dehydrogenase